MVDNHKNSRTKFGDDMNLSAVASVRTGFVSGRKRAQGDAIPGFRYQLLNLKCLTDTGGLNTVFADEYFSTEQIKDEFLTRKGDVLLRLSAPYSSVLIQDDMQCGYLIPSHFAIIRVTGQTLLPEYVLWQLRRAKTKQFILQNSSGSSAFGTISSGFIASLQIEEIPLQQQRALGQLTLLEDREQLLLYQLSQEKLEFITRLTEASFASTERGK